MNQTPPSIYNSLTHEIEAVEANGTMGLYVCGVTPYDTAHLGHAFTYTSFDLLVRYLRYLGHTITYVQNVTDIDDDILKRARATGTNWKELGDRETAKFVAAMAALNNLAPDVIPRATEHIPEMLAICARLLETGAAYESAGNVYFDVRRPESFGSLFRAPYAEQLRVANEHGNFPDDPNKRDPLDFVLWQAKQEGEPSWPSPWGEGRPGWHIECSAMSMKYLGETLTFHGGGQDLIFPHHDCEIAQSERYTGKPFVRYWVHTGLVALGPEKMSKSLGNMVFVADLLLRYRADAIRLLLIANHYRSSWEYTEAAMSAAAAREQALHTTLTGEDEATGGEVAQHGAAFLDAMAADLDAPRALDELERLAASGDAAARRTALGLGRRVLGLRLGE